jgi:UDP-glucose 4-epimerase
MIDPLKEKNVLVTGGAGFIGSHLCEKLLVKNNRVVLLDNLSSGNINNIPKNGNLEFINGDIRDIKLVDALVQKTEIVFHLAEYIPPTKEYGSGHVIKYSTEKPLIDFDVSAKGSLVILNSVNRHNKRLVFTSTAAVYGNTQNPISENSPPQPLSPYGVSKLCAEEYIKQYSRLEGTRSTILRLFNVYGPRQTKYVMYDTLLKLTKNEHELELFGTGKEERDFVFVSDVVDAFILAAEKDEMIGKTFNVGTGIATNISDLMTFMIELLELNPKLHFKGTSWKGDLPKLVANISEISKMGFKPKMPLKQGLEKFISHFNSYIGK